MPEQCAVAADGRKTNSSAVMRRFFLSACALISLTHPMPQSDSPIIVSTGINRRRFIYTSALGLSAVALRAHAASKPRIVSPNSKANVAAIAAGGKGGTDIAGISGYNGDDKTTTENVIALCDVDKNTLDAALQKYPGAKVYQDYREMLEKEKNIDAVN